MTSPRGLLIRFAQPLDFDAIDDIPTDIAFVLLFGENNRGEYLNVLAAIARRLQSEGVLAAMRKARSVDEFYSDFIADSARVRKNSLPALNLLPAEAGKANREQGAASALFIRSRAGDAGNRRFRRRRLLRRGTEG